jgi:CubicO group peptidase (beta-lactamase class C family)
VDQAELALVFDQLDGEHGLSGAVLVSRGGEVLFEKAYGFASRQLHVPNTLDTRFHIASVSKMFIAMAALILYEQGRIDLQARPAAYMPELGALDEHITLHHLLSHTSGLRDIYDVPHLRFEMSKLKIEQGDFLTYLEQQPQLFAPGQGWSYSSTGYILLGFIMQRVTGLAFSDVMQRSVLAPLSLANMGLDLPRKINSGRAYGHTVEDGQVVNADNDELSEIDAPGELYATVGDLKRWCDAMFECPLVAPQTLARMFTPHAEVEAGMHYGYGWFLAPRFRMHGGGTPGFVSQIRQYLKQEVSVILLFNADHVGPKAIIDVVEPLIMA